MKSFDCRATAAVLNSGGSLALAGHVATIIGVLLNGNAWMKGCAVLVWCAIVYLSIRVKMDVRFFELLADHPADQLDAWLDGAGLRKHAPPRTIERRSRGALRLWRALAITVVIEIALMFAAVLHLVP
jgi:hypothetical protein